MAQAPEVVHGSRIKIEHRQLIFIIVFIQAPAQADLATDKTRGSRHIILFDLPY